MKGTTAIFTGATALAATAMLFGVTPAIAAGVTNAAGQQAQSFSIQRVAVPAAHTAIEGPDFKACCNIFSC